jgi:hypothetical protein
MDEIASVAVNPAVVAAPKLRGIPSDVSTNRIASMATRVQEDMKLAIVVTCDDERLSSDPGRPEIAGVWNLTLMSEVHPRRGKNAL